MEQLDEDPPSYSADFSRFCPRDQRTQKSHLCEGLIINKDGLLARAELKGPHDIESLLACMDMHHVCLLMAGCVAPPRLVAYRDFIVQLNKQYPDWYPLLYQQLDRWMFEEIPELHRLQIQKWDKRAKRGYWQTVEDVDEDSVFDINYPLGHLLWMTIHSSYATEWWEKNFVRHANGTKKTVPMADLLEGDAPIAARAADHASTAFTGQQQITALHGKQREHPEWQPSKKQRKQAAAQQKASGAQQKAQTKEICHMFNLGKCGTPCRHARIHTCTVCGRTGHPATECYQASKSKAEGGKGKGKAEGGKGKRQRRGNNRG